MKKLSVIEFYNAVLSKELLQEKTEGIVNVRKLKGILSKLSHRIIRKSKFKNKVKSLNKKRSKFQNSYSWEDVEKLEELDEELVFSCVQLVLNTMGRRYYADGMFWLPQEIIIEYSKKFTAEFKKNKNAYDTLKKKSNLTPEELKVFIGLHHYLISAPDDIHIVVFWTDHKALDQKFLDDLIASKESIYPEMAKKHPSGEVIDLDKDEKKTLIDMMRTIIFGYANLNVEGNNDQWTREMFDSPFIQSTYEVIPGNDYFDEPEETDNGGWEVDDSFLDCFYRISYTITKNPNIE